MGHEQVDGGRHRHLDAGVSLVGAIGAGILADRYGRVRVLRWTIVLFCVSCFLCGPPTAPNS